MGDTLGDLVVNLRADFGDAQAQFEKLMGQIKETSARTEEGRATIEKLGEALTSALPSIDSLAAAQKGAAETADAFVSALNEGIAAKFGADAAEQAAAAQQQLSQNLQAAAEAGRDLDSFLGDTPGFKQAEEMTRSEQAALEKLEESYRSLAPEISAADAAIAAAGAQATESAAQMSLFGDAASSIPWADTVGQLNLFATELEPIGAEATKAAAGLDQAAQAAEGAGSAALQFSAGAQALIDKQNQAEAAVTQAKAVMDELAAAYAQGAVSADVVTRATEQYDAALVKAGQQVEQIGPQFKALDENAQHAEAGLKGMAEQLIAVGEALVIAGALKEFGASALEAYSNLQQATNSLTALTGSAEQARGVIESIDALVKTHPFGDEQMFAASQKLAAYGVEAAKIPTILEDAANTARATGNSFDTITSALGRVALTGQVNARQLVQFGVSWQDLAKTAGVSISEVQELLKKGGQDAAADMDLLLKTVENKFGAFSRVPLSVAEQWKVVKNQTEQAMEAIGAGLAPLASQIMSVVGGQIIPAVASIAKEFAALPPVIRDTTAALGMAVPAVAGAAAGLGALGLGIAGLRLSATEVSGLLTKMGVSTAALSTAASAAVPVLASVGTVIAAIHITDTDTAAARLATTMGGAFVDSMREARLTLAAFAGDLSPLPAGMIALATASADGLAEMVRRASEFQITWKGTFDILFPQIAGVRDGMNQVADAIDYMRGNTSAAADGLNKIASAAHNASIAGQEFQAAWNLSVQQLTHAVPQAITSFIGKQQELNLNLKTAQQVLDAVTKSYKNHTEIMPGVIANASMLSAAQKQVQDAQSKVTVTLKDAIPTLASLTAEQDKHAKSAQAAQAIVTTLFDRWQAGKGSLESVAAAYAKLSGELKKAGDAGADFDTVQQHLIIEHAALNARAQNAQAIFSTLFSLWQAGKISLDNLVFSYQNLSKAMKAAADGMPSVVEREQAIILKQAEMEQNARTAIQTYMDLAKSWELGDPIMVKAMDDVSKAVKATGLTLDELGAKFPDLGVKAANWGIQMLKAGKDVTPALNDVVGRLEDMAIQQDKVAAGASKMGAAISSGLAASGKAFEVVQAGLNNINQGFQILQSGQDYVTKGFQVVSSTGLIAASNLETNWRKVLDPLGLIQAALENIGSTVSGITAQQNADIPILIGHIKEGTSQFLALADAEESTLAPLRDAGLLIEKNTSLADLLARNMGTAADDTNLFDASTLRSIGHMSTLGDHAHRVRGEIGGMADGMDLFNSRIIESIGEMGTLSDEIRSITARLIADMGRPPTGELLPGGPGGYRQPTGTPMPGGNTSNAAWGLPDSFLYPGSVYRGAAAPVEAAGAPSGSPAGGYPVRVGGGVEGPAQTGTVILTSTLLDALTGSSGSLLAAIERTLSGGASLEDVQAQLLKLGVEAEITSDGTLEITRQVAAAADALGSVAEAVSAGFTTLPQAFAQAVQEALAPVGPQLPGAGFTAGSLPLPPIPELNLPAVGPQLPGAGFTALAPAWPTYQQLFPRALPASFDANAMRSNAGNVININAPFNFRNRSDADYLVEQLQRLNVRA